MDSNSQQSQGSIPKHVNLQNLPHVEVVSLVITCDKHIMAVHNHLWGSYTLPLTKLRTPEELTDAAVRLGCEYTGKLFQRDLNVVSTQPISAADGIWPVPKYLLKAGERRQGDRDGIEKIYLFHIFGLDMDEKPQLPSGVRCAWLTVDDFKNSTLCPLSGTARFLIETLTKYAEGKGKSFPDREIIWPQ